MLQKPDVERILKLHEKAFALFRWLNAHLLAGWTRIEQVEQALTFSAATKAVVLSKTPSSLNWIK